MIAFNPQDLVIIGTLIVLEGLLSADNALVLALLVRHLPKDQQHKALLYGLVGAFVLRGVMIALAGIIIKLWWMCALGAAYLIFLAVKHFVAKQHDEDAATAKAGMSFWQTVAVVEFTDIVFAVDSILVAVALVNDPQKLWIVYTGGFIGIIMLRMAAGFFIKLIRKYPTLDNMAYALVGWAGVKLASTAGHLYSDQYGGALPELPKPVFWTVFVFIVAAGVWSALRHKATPEDLAKQTEMEEEVATLEEVETKEKKEPHMVMIISGILSLAIGGISFLWAAPKMDIIRSGWGQVGIALGGQGAAQEAQLYQMGYYGGIILMILGGVLLVCGIIQQSARVNQQK